MTGRFAPSPSGQLHLGNIRTALIAWLHARSQSETFVLRIDDLDGSRSRIEHEKSQLNDLKLIGIDWDKPPSRQSARQAQYEAAVATLRDLDVVYPCWCTRAELRAIANAPNSPIQNSDHYLGGCGKLDTAGRLAKELQADGRAPAWRVRTDVSEMVFDDLVAGTVSSVTDDFVICRGSWNISPTKDLEIAYNLAVVIDDQLDNVTQIIRGNDLLSSTPRQIWLRQTLNLSPTNFGHVPLILGSNGRRLAKSDGAVTVDQITKLGFKPDQIVSALLASIGLANELSSSQIAAEPQQSLYQLAKTFRIESLRDIPNSQIDGMLN